MEDYTFIDKLITNKYKKKQCPLWGQYSVCSCGLDIYDLEFPNVGHKNGLWPNNELWPL